MTKNCNIREKASVSFEPPNYWSPVRHANHYTKWAGCEWGTQKSFHTVIVDWFQLNSANSANQMNLIQNRNVMSSLLITYFASFQVFFWVDPFWNGFILLQVIKSIHLLGLIVNLLISVGISFTNIHLHCLWWCLLKNVLLYIFL